MKKLINHLTEEPDPDIQVLTDLFTNFRLRPNRYVKRGIILKPGFHLQQSPRPRHKQQSDYVVEQSSFPLIALFWSLSWSKLASWKPGFRIHSELFGYKNFSRFNASALLSFLKAACSSSIIAPSV